MDLNFGFKPALEQRLVYIRAIDMSEVPAEVHADEDMPAQLYAIHTDAGEQIAILGEREAAFMMARDQQMIPHSVH